MTDQHLFFLDADQKWDLAYDRNQWMIRKRQSDRKLSARAMEAGHSAERWEAMWFIGSHKDGLMPFVDGTSHTSHEKDRPRIVLTDEAQTKIDALPDLFLTWIPPFLDRRAQLAMLEAAE